MKSKRLFILAMLIMSFVALPAQHDSYKPRNNRPLVIVGAWHIPPYFIKDYNGKPRGFCIEILTTILKRKNIPYIIKIESWDKSKQDILDGKADLTCMMFNNEAAKKFQFGPILKYTPMCAVFRDTDKPILTTSDLNGKSIFVLKMSRSNDIIHEYRFKGKLVYGNNIEDNFINLSKGQCDALFCNEISAQYFIGLLHLKNLKFKEMAIAPQENRIAGNDDKLLKMMEEELYKMKLDGSYDKIENKWFNKYKHEPIPLIVYFIVGFLVALAISLYFIIVILNKRIRNNEKNRTELFKKYKVIFDNAMIGILYYDNNGILVEANDIARKLYSIPDDKELAKIHASIFDNPELKKFFDKETLKPYCGINRWDFDEISKSGYFRQGMPTGIHYIESRINPIFDSNKKMICIIYTSRDVTDMVNNQKELEVEKEKAMESDRLKSEFLANISHEIRTPLNATVGFSDILRETTDKKEIDNYYNIIDKNSKTLLNLINDILDLSKIEAGYIDIHIQKFDITDLFKTMHESLDKLDIKQDIEFICNVPYDKCLIDADQHRVAQILTNFVTNAFKYTKKGHVMMSYECVDDGIKLIVEDTGMGIAKDKLGLVFSRFEKIGSIKQGTGLGLAICKAITDRCKGKIGVESTLGEGSTFWAWLPAKTEIPKK